MPTNSFTRPIIAPSILAADFAKLGEEIAAVSNAGWLHVDVMDGHFVPNLSFGGDVTAAVSRSTDLALDVHLMIENPEAWIDTYVKAGADCIIFHVEATGDPLGLARKIKEHGVRAGFSIKPGTPIEDYLPNLNEFDLVLVMSVEPGFGGQKFMPEQLEKVRTLRSYIDEHKLTTLIEIDGGISAETISAAAEAGCDAFVAGSAIYGQTDRAQAVEELRQLAQAAY
ncbi:Ribulose-phosphate 3-epimerase [Corynebacterium kutscheri]|uniref:Ribulose-phosphate 3-epimerase n=1 Tax=Corynebacterium kutscheri TaxID=35755 RepID=A0A0F6TD37_9CORY|nr:ribulose-phosphate 3-epimerase [Corynebacterium kutscheri]AKE41294.1 ribulose-phosphate 3-epimerase [Corynebacterium kutscheri]VEH08570.1 Ribulose-phosphate 3-epimerase [Corynebacterium kutscheri]VEH09616.1 Ribulose-phosphate 3-epimerase [Corynebacterium kutscheri]VEH79699.1 Ribulose-phosphate 3-epimerase [Corynebacterium kutscheri]